jgi:hypothetical protein
MKDQGITISFEFMPTRNGGIIPAGTRETLTINCIDGMALCKMKNSKNTKNLKLLDKTGQYLEKSETFVSYYPDWNKEEIAKDLGEKLRRINGVK